MLSLFLTVNACEPGQRDWTVLYTFLSIIFSFGSMILMEYYIGMEIYRFALIYLMNREQAGNGKPKAFFKSLLSYLPYLIPAAGFVAWRTFVFSAQRNGTDVIGEIVRPFLVHPRHEILDFGMRQPRSLVDRLDRQDGSVPAAEARGPHYTLHVRAVRDGRRDYANRGKKPTQFF